MSIWLRFWLCFVTKRDFDCEQVEQQTSQTDVSVVRLSEITPLITVWQRTKDTNTLHSFVIIHRWQLCGVLVADLK